MKITQVFRRQKKFQLTIWLLFALIVGPLACWTVYWCWQDTQSHTNMFIVPDGFHGYFRIIGDPKTGIDVPYVHNTYIYRIPPSGVLVVKSFDPFTTWGVDQAQYASGTPIACAYRDPDIKIDPKAIALRSGAATISNTRQRIVFTIGTEKDANKSPEH